MSDETKNETEVKKDTTEKITKEKETNAFEKVKVFTSQLGNANTGELYKKLEPVINVLSSCLNTVAPYIVNTVNSCKKVYNSLPLDFVFAFVGLILAFFGGSFAALIAGIEAMGQAGFEKVYQNILYIYKETEDVIEASKKDDSLDENNDGVADVLQITVKELFTRKLKLFFASVDDPQQVLNCFYDITALFSAALCVLKIEFAKVISLGATIGNQMIKLSTPILTPVICSILPKQYQQWIAPVIEMVCKAIAISIAWFIQRVISSVQSGVRGGLMFSRRMLKYGNDQGYFKFNEEESYLDEIIGWTVAAIGIYVQIRLGFSLPFPLNVLLFPFSFAENTIVWCISE
eukprot:gene11134-3953_t